MDNGARQHDKCSKAGQCGSGYVREHGSIADFAFLGIRDNLKRRMRVAGAIADALHHERCGAFVHVFGIRHLVIDAFYKGSTVELHDGIGLNGVARAHVVGNHVDGCVRQVGRQNHETRFHGARVIAHASDSCMHRARIDEVAVELHVEIDALAKRSLGFLAIFDRIDAQGYRGTLFGAIVHCVLQALHAGGGNIGCLEGFEGLFRLVVCRKRRAKFSAYRIGGCEDGIAGGCCAIAFGIVGEGRGGEHGGAQRERACGAGKGAGVLWHSHLLRNSASIQCD